MVVVNVGGEKKNCVQKKNQINKTEKKTKTEKMVKILLTCLKGDNKSVN